MRTASRALLLAACCIVSCSAEKSPELGAASQSISDVFSHDRFRRAASCKSCDVLHVAPLHLPETAQHAASAKLRAPDGTFRGVTIDSLGSVVSERGLADAERAASHNRRGKLRPEVAAWIANAAASDRLWTWIWTNASVEPGRREDLIKDATASIAMRTTATKAASDATTPVRDWLAANAPAAALGESAGPLVRARLTASEIKLLAGLSQVVQIGTDAYPGSGQSLPWSATSEWGQTLRLHAAHDVSLGSGARVCIKEATQPDSYQLLGALPVANPGGPTSGHTRATTGIVRNTATEDGWWFSVAPSADLFIANWEGFNGGGGVDAWCANNAATTLSYSHSVLAGGAGGLSGTDMQHDWLAKVSPYMLVVAAAGNVATGTHVQNRGFNGLVVGGSVDGNTPSYNDDAHDNSSAWQNPTTLHNDYELPHVAAPSNGADAAGASVTGTSAATAMVAGVSALIDSIDPSLSYWPEAKRAIIAATALTQGHLGVRSLPSSGGDAKLGAGIVNAAHAARLAQPAWAADAYGQTTVARHGRLARTVTFGSDFGADGYLTARWKARATTDGRLRVVLAFDATAQCSGFGGPCTSDVPDADLDLHLIKKTDTGWTTAGTLVCSSVTYDSTWEMCDVPVLAGEEYLIAVRKWSNTAASTYMGVAWMHYQLPGGAVCTSSAECSSAACINGICREGEPNSNVTSVSDIEVSWESDADTITGPTPIGGQLPFLVKNSSSSPLSVNLFAVAAGLDARRGRRFLESIPVAQGATIQRWLPLQSAPIRSVGETSQLRIEAEIVQNGVVMSNVWSREIYYEVDAAMTTLTFYGTQGKAYPVDWQNGSLQNVDSTIASLAATAANVAGEYWNGTQFVSWSPPAADRPVIGQGIVLKGNGPFIDAIRSYPPTPDAPPPPPPTDPQRLCSAWAASFSDGRDGAFLTSIGGIAIDARYARAVVHDPAGAVVFSDYLDADGCTRTLYLRRNTVYSLTLSPELARDGAQISIRYNSTKSAVFVLPFRTASTAPVFPTIGLDNTKEDEVTRVAAVATQILMTPDRGLVSGATYLAYANDGCPTCGQGASNGLNLGWMASYRKYVVAHEFGHVVQGIAAGDANAIDMATHYDWWSTSNPAVCQCMHVEDPGGTWPAAPPAGPGGTNRVHCLQSNIPDHGAHKEGFGQFFASRVFNAFDGSAPCVFAYYKQSFDDDTAAPVPIGTAYDCRKRVQWMEARCPATMFQRGTERDYLGFLYSANVSTAVPGTSAPTTMDQLFTIMKNTCNPTTGAKCTTGQWWHWTDLVKQSNKLAGGAMSDRARHYVAMGDAYGVNH